MYSTLTTLITGLYWCGWCTYVDRRRPIWYLIFTLYIVGGVLDFAAYGLAPLSLLAPVASLTIVMNAILAYFAFSEKLTYRDLVGSVIIIVSAVVATAFGSRESAVIDLEGLLRLWRHDVWLVFMSFELFLMIAAYALVHVWDPAWPGWSVWWRAYRTVKCGDCCGGCCIDSRYDRPTDRPTDRMQLNVGPRLPSARF